MSAQSFARAIGRARVAQVERVNGVSRDLAEDRQSVAQAAMAITNQRLAEARAEIEHLRDRLALYETEGAHGNLRLLGAPATLTFAGRPVLTADQVAQQVGRSLATVSRYCASGFWQAEQVGGQWLIYADQALTTKR